MKQKQTILAVLTVIILIVIGFRMGGYREYIPSPILWVLVGTQLGLSYFWKPKTP